MFKHEIAEIAGKGTRQATRQVIANWRVAPSCWRIRPFGTAFHTESAVAGAGRCPQGPGCVPQQQRDWQTESQHHQAQEAQAPLEPGRDALHLREAAQDRARLLLKGRPAQAALPVIVGDAIPSLRHWRAFSEKGS